MGGGVAVEVTVAARMADVAVARVTGEIWSGIELAVGGLLKTASAVAVAAASAADNRLKDVWPSGTATVTITGGGIGPLVGGKVRGAVGLTAETVVALVWQALRKAATSRNIKAPINRPGLRPACW